MMLRCALLDGASSWRQLLAQEGVPWIPLDLAGLDASQASVVIVDRPLLRAEAERLRTYVLQGGALLGAARYLSGVTGIPVRREHVRYLLDGRHTASVWIDLLDVGLPCQIPREANSLRTQENTFGAFAGAYGAGAVVMLPFDMRDLWHYQGMVLRSFYSPFERLPYERVSFAARAELLHLVHSCLEFLHHVRGLPYVRVWPFPDGAPSMVAFRLDTDFATEGQTMAFLRLSRELGLPFTWFLDTKSHEPWLHAFAEMQDQEIGIHCYDHDELMTAEGIRSDIRKARQLLEGAAVRPSGYAAPYGAWRPVAGEVLDEEAVPYSSEFGAGYDGFPFFPELPGRRFRTLQVPVHPISAGALRRAGYSPTRMVEYFEHVASRKALFGEPLFFYDHPVHGYVEVARSFLAATLGRGAVPTTLGTFAAWWRERLHALASLHLQWAEPSLVIPDLPEAPGRIRLAVTTKEGACVVAPRPLLRKEELALQRQPEIPPREDIRRIREFDLRGMIGKAFSMFQGRRVR